MNPKISRRVIAQTIAAKLLAEPARRKHWLKVLAAYLVEQKMAEDVDLVANDLARELFLQSGHLLTEVTSAHPFTNGLREELVRWLKQVTGARHIELRETIDRDLLGGFIAHTPDAEIDTSVRRQLKQLSTIS